MISWGQLCKPLNVSGLINQAAFSNTIASMGKPVVALGNIWFLSVLLKVTQICYVRRSDLRSIPWLAIMTGFVGLTSKG